MGADYWDWQYGAPFRWGVKDDAESGEEAPAAGAAAAAGAADRDGAYDEVGKMVRSAVQHAAPPRAASPGGGGSRGRGGNGGGGFVAGLDLSIPVTLRSADELRTPFTNHVRGYQGLLDYIW